MLIYLVHHLGMAVFLRESSKMPKRESKLLGERPMHSTIELTKEILLNERQNLRN